MKKRKIMALLLAAAMLPLLLTGCSCYNDDNHHMPKDSNVSDNSNVSDSSNEQEEDPDALKFKDLFGTYDNGTLTIVDITMNDVVRSHIDKNSSDDYYVLPKLEKNLNVAIKAPFTIEEVTGNVGNLTFKARQFLNLLVDNETALASYDPESLNTFFHMTFDPTNGNMEGEGEYGSISEGDFSTITVLNSDVTEDKIVISGDIKLSFVSEDKPGNYLEGGEFSCIIHLEASKPRE